MYKNNFNTHSYTEVYIRYKICTQKLGTISNSCFKRVNNLTNVETANAIYFYFDLSKYNTFQICIHIIIFTIITHLTPHNSLRL